MTKRARIAWAGAAALCALASAPARAEEGEPEADRLVATGPEVVAAVREGAMLPLTLAPSVSGAAALALGFAGYDGARSAPIGTATAEVRIWGPLAIRGGADYSNASRQLRPTIGGRVQLLRQDRHGIDGSITLFYRPEGFTEPEGEIESSISVGRRFGRYSVIGNLVYGQDPEGNERDGEVHLAAVYGAGRSTIGVDSRFRFAIGSQQTATARTEPKLDLLAGPVASTVIGPVAVFAHAGPSMLKLGDVTSVGVAGLAGVGSVF